MRAPIVRNVFIFLFLFGFLPTLLFAGGAKDTDPLEKARQLIDQKDYNQAYTYIRQALLQSTDRMDETQSFLQVIAQRRVATNNLITELITKITENPDDYEKILPLLDQISALNPYPNQKDKDLIRNATLFVALKRDQSEFQKLIARAHELVLQQKFAEAIALYRTGFTLQQSAFKETIPDKALGDRVIAKLKEAETAIDAYSGILTTLNPRIDSFIAALSGGAQGAQDLFTQWPAIQPQYLETIRLIQTIESYKTFFAETLVQAKAIAGSEWATPYLGFINELITGPPKTSEGIAFSVRENLEYKFVPALAQLSRTRGSFSTQMDEAAKNQDWKTVRSALKLYENTALLELQVATVQKGSDPGQTKTIDELQKTILPAVQKENIGLLRELRAYRYLASLTDTIDAAATIAATGDSTDASKDTRFEQALSLYDALPKSLAQIGDSLQGDVKAGLADGSDLSSLQRVWEATYSYARFQTLQIANASFERNFATRLGNLQEKLTPGKDDFSKATALIAGVLDDDTRIPHLYPDKALPLLGTAEASLTSLRAEILDFESFFAKVSSILLTTSGIQEKLSSEIALKRDVEGILSAITTTRAKADTLIAQSKSFVEQAKGNFGAASDSVAQVQKLVDDALAPANQASISTVSTDQIVTILGSARSSEASSGSLWDQAFSLSWDKTARDAEEADRKALRDKMVLIQDASLKIQIRVTIADARTSARNAYYDSALLLITEALSNYNKLSFPDNAKDEHDQITLLSNLISGLKILSQNKFIFESDPDYLALSDWLNDATNLYNQAKKITDPSQKALRDSYINLARTNAANVLNRKPKNQEAKILQIRLNQLAADDPYQFAGQFYVEVLNSLAEAIVKDPKADADPNVAYLEILQELDPAVLKKVNADANYRNQIAFAQFNTDLGVFKNTMKDLDTATWRDLTANFTLDKDVKTSLKVALGAASKYISYYYKKVIPPNALSQITALIDAATARLKAGSVTEYEAGIRLALSAEALSSQYNYIKGLNDAPALRNKLQGLIDNFKRTAFTTADLALYNQARNYYAQGNFEQCRAIVDQIWSDPRNQKIALLVTLRDRLDREGH